MSTKDISVSPLTQSCSVEPTADISKLTDEELLSLVKAGQGDALTVIFDRYYRLVLSTGLKIVRDRGEAEDVMQEVFFEIYRKAYLFNPQKGSLKTWILQYAYHRSMDRRQYLTLRKFYDRQAEPTGHTRPLEPHYSMNGSYGLTDAERDRIVGRALASLSDHQRKAIELVCFQGLLMEEVSERLGSSRAQVQHYYYRGLKKLRETVRGLIRGTKEVA